MLINLVIWLTGALVLAVIDTYLTIIIWPFDFVFRVVFMESAPGIMSFGLCGAVIQAIFIKASYFHKIGIIPLIYIATFTSLISSYTSYVIDILMLENVSFSFANLWSIEFILRFAFFFIPSIVFATLSYHANKYINMPTKN